jgi:hypothetical protein
LTDKYHHLTIEASSSPDNVGSFKIVDVTLSPNSVVLERYDGKVFVADSAVDWHFTAGAKITVLPGTYNPFDIPNSINDLEIEAWGDGNDVVIAGTDAVTTLINVAGCRNKIKGLRLEGGHPATGVGFAITGSDNVFEGNVYGTANRVSIASTAFRNKILDAPEDYRRTTYTVGVAQSRADYVGLAASGVYSFSSVLQNAINVANADSHIKEVRLGAGTYVLDSTVTVPANIIITGSGYGTHIQGDGTFSAFTLDTAGNQTVTGIRFDNFTYSMTASGATAGVFAYGNWLESAAIDTVISGQLTMNI